MTGLARIGLLVPIAAMPAGLTQFCLVVRIDIANSHYPQKDLSTRRPKPFSYPMSTKK